MKKLIGTAALGNSNVRLFADPATSSGFFTCNYNVVKDLPYIVVGLNHDRWWQCLAVLLHEVHELMLVNLNRRFEVAGDMAGNSSAYHFFLDHQQFAEMCAQSAYFVEKMYAPLHKAWRERAK